ncbi:MAG: trypsin-like peptidase domain-containing protein [Elusimicrobia bacterium]|nr:trypsin-like peptidase domain-containing protein [Elusimicrobiota bacterium]
MKTFKTAMNATLLMLLPLAAFAQADKSIYGSDNRKDLFQMSSDIKTLADSVVSFWKADKIEALNPGGVQLKTVNFGERLNLCQDVAFREQPIGAFCSGSLVGPDLVMTAGHCVRTEADCQNTKLVFGFAVKQAGGAAATAVPASEVYSCSKIVKRFLTGEPNSAPPAGQTLGADFALIKLDRPVSGHKPLAINRANTLKAGDGIFVIGHPVGLPVKLADDARVRDASKIGYFVADLDTFGGNSGSPVFNLRTRKIEGILVRGDEDFTDSPSGCTTMATYAQTGGRGEDVTKISVLSSFIPKLAGEKSAGDDGMQESVGMDTGAISVDQPALHLSFE